MEAKAYDEIKKIDSDPRKHALKLWQQWVSPKILPIPLSIERASKITESFVGPVLTEPLLKLPEKSEKAAVSYAANLRARPEAIGYGQLKPKIKIDPCFKKKVLETLTFSSPFSVSHNSFCSPESLMAMTSSIKILLPKIPFPIPAIP